MASPGPTQALGPRRLIVRHRERRVQARVEAAVVGDCGGSTADRMAAPGRRGVSDRHHIERLGREARGELADQAPGRAADPAPSSSMRAPPPGLAQHHLGGIGVGRDRHDRAPQPARRLR